LAISSAQASASLRLGSLAAALLPHSGTFGRSVPLHQGLAGLASRLTQLTIAALVSRVIDQTLKDELIRARLSHLGFDLEKDGFGWMVRDRREAREGIS